MECGRVPSSLSCIVIINKRGSNFGLSSVNNVSMFGRELTVLYRKLVRGCPATGVFFFAQ